jgi:hypothetical protein
METIHSQKKKSFDITLHGVTTKFILLVWISIDTELNNKYVNHYGKLIIKYVYFQNRAEKISIFFLLTKNIKLCNKQ